MGELNNQVAIVTGGAQGIGKAVALQLAGAGASIVVADLNEEAAGATTRDIEEKGMKAVAVKVDVGDADSVNGMIEKALDSFSRIDILINNAGITRDGLLIRMDEEDWDMVIQVNLKGVFNCTRAVAKVMMKQRSGRIVNISSIVGLQGGYHRHDQIRRPGAGAPGHHCQRHRSGVYRDGHDKGFAPKSEGGFLERHSPGTLRLPGGRGRRRLLPCL